MQGQQQRMRPCTSCSLRASSARPSSSTRGPDEGRVDVGVAELVEMGHSSRARTVDVNSRRQPGTLPGTRRAGVRPMAN